VFCYHPADAQARLRALSLASELAQYVATGLLVGGVYALSGGEQQMVALGRGLMAQPDLLLLDEPSQGLGPRIVEQIFETIDRIRKSRRLTILLVEQRVVEALELCDRGYVLETGRVALEGSHATLLADPRVQRAYLGA
jgi:branched-chain amino acid transport system ATP-binding protein